MSYWARLARPCPAALDLITLVLAAFESLDWELTLGPDTVLTEVILHGKESGEVYTVTGLQEDTVLTEVTVETASGSQCSSPHHWESPDWEACNTQDFIALVEEMTGLTWTSWAGCYRGLQWMTGPEAFNWRLE